jgi:hypothetical protein
MELNKLNVLSAGSLKNVQIAVTHIKPCENCTEKIIKEIEESNNLGLRIVYPKQAVPMIIK